MRNGAQWWELRLGRTPEHSSDAWVRVVCSADGRVQLEPVMRTSSFKRCEDRALAALGALVADGVVHASFRWHRNARDVERQAEAWFHALLLDELRARPVSSGVYRIKGVGDAGVAGA
jgi:hypothetical protein